MELFLTAPDVAEVDGEALSGNTSHTTEIKINRRRIGLTDVIRHIEKGTKEGTLVYVCGPQGMTDGIVEGLGKEAGLRKEQVLCEKWW